MLWYCAIIIEKAPACECEFAPTSSTTHHRHTSFFFPKTMKDYKNTFPTLNVLPAMVKFLSNQLPTTRPTQFCTTSKLSGFKILVILIIIHLNPKMHRNTDVEGMHFFLVVNK